MQKLAEERNEHQKLLELGKYAARSAGNTLKSFSREVLKSEGKDIKLVADEVVHTIILESLRPSNIPILSEENEHHIFSHKRAWVVDPLDGSLNFSRGIPNSAVSIALMEEEKSIIGVIYDFWRDELYTGVLGEDARMNDTPIRVSDVLKKQSAVIMSGFPSYTDYSHDALQQYINIVQSFKKVRCIGSAALSLAYVASGRADVYYEKDIKVWDVAAGLALVEAAGGVCSMSQIGTEGKCTVFASNGNVLLSI
jgi:myo-inositol-1(or 4)-monophosphatase